MRHIRRPMHYLLEQFSIQFGSVPLIAQRWTKQDEKRRGTREPGGQREPEPKSELGSIKDYKEGVRGKYGGIRSSTKLE